MKKIILIKLMISLVFLQIFSMNSALGREVMPEVLEGYEPEFITEAPTNSLFLTEPPVSYVTPGNSCDDGYTKGTLMSPNRREGEDTVKLICLSISHLIEKLAYKTYITHECAEGFIKGVQLPHPFGIVYPGFSDKILCLNKETVLKTNKYETQKKNNCLKGFTKQTIFNSPNITCLRK